MNFVFIQLLGFLYEAGFKLGFLEKELEKETFFDFFDYKSFRDNGIFAFIRNKIIELELENKEKLEKFWEIIYQKFISNDCIWKELKNSFDCGIKESIIYLIFRTGYEQGKFFSEQFSDKIELIQYSMETGSSISGKYVNADLMFIGRNKNDNHNTLHVLDFKLAGTGHIFNMLLENKNKNFYFDIPFSTYGIPVSLSFGEFSLSKIVENLLEQKDKILSLQEIYGEIKGFVQILSYAVDYIVEKNEKIRQNEIKELLVGLIYPLAEPFIARFFIDIDIDIDINKTNHIEYQQKLRDFYSEIKKEIKEKPSVYQKIEDISSKDKYIRKQRIIRELKEKKEEIQKRIAELEKSEERLLPGSIKDTRDHVSRAVEEFFKTPENIKCLVLLHSAGSGKTTTVREKLLELEGCHIVWYMTTRKVILDREISELEKYKEQNKKIHIVNVYSELKNTKNFKLVSQGDTYESLGNSSGKMRETAEKVKKIASEIILENKLKHDIIWAFVTQQAVVDVKFKGRNLYIEDGKRCTLQHIYTSGLLSPNIVKNFTFHFILDEFLGYNNGLFLISELIKLVKSIEQKGGKAYLYLFDANGFSPTVMPKLLKEYKECSVLPPSLAICDYKEEYETVIDGIKMYGYTKHGYPSKELIVKRNFIQVKNPVKRNQEIVDEITKIIQQNFSEKEKEKNTAFVFVQDKNIIAQLQAKLIEKGYTTLIATTDSKQSQSQIQKGNEDIIIATSAISRGIDLSRPHKPVSYIYTVVFDFGLENYLVELIQAVSRTRGDEKTENSSKILHLIYIIENIENKIDDLINSFKDYDSISIDLDRNILLEMMEVHYSEQKLLLDEVLSKIVKQFISKEKDKNIGYIVPIPAQYKTVYIPNTISTLENCISFLDNIFQLEINNQNKKIALFIKQLRDELIEKIAIKTETLKDNLMRKNYSYYHPYILIEEQKIKFIFEDNIDQQDKNKTILNRFKDLLLKNYCNSYDKEITEILEVLSKHNEEKTKQLKDLLIELYNKEYLIPILLPSYSLVFSDFFLDEHEKIRFSVRKKIGRAGASILGGRLSPKTYCTGIGQEYAVIPLGEDYPYKEVLSGRFAKFPIEFVRNLIEKKKGG